MLLLDQALLVVFFGWGLSSDWKLKLKMRPSFGRNLSGMNPIIDEKLGSMDTCVDTNTGEDMDMRPSRFVTRKVQGHTMIFLVIYYIFINTQQIKLQGHAMRRKKCRTCVDISSIFYKAL